MTIRTRTLPAAIVSLFVMTASLCVSGDAPPAAAVEPPVPGDVRAALQDRRYADAVRALDRLVRQGREAADYWLYLKGLAQSYAGLQADAVATLGGLEEQYPQSLWAQKARFARAEAYLALRQYEMAERIYDAGARRLMDPARKEALAGVLIALADKLSTPKDETSPDGPDPDYSQARQLYAAALEFEIGRPLRDEVMLKLGTTMEAAGSWQEAVGALEAYLKEFDPDWPEAQAGIPSPGAHVLQARYDLGLSYQKLDRLEDARRAWQDLVALADRKGVQTPEADKLRAGAMYGIAGTYNADDVAEGLLAVKALRDYLARYPAGEDAVQAAFTIAVLYETIGRHADAGSAYRDFLAGKGYRAETEKAKDLLLHLCMQAEYRLGAVYFVQKDYDGARAVWNVYIANHPAGPQWNDCQKGIIEADYRTGADLRAQKKYAEARAAWAAFLQKYPLDPRVRQIMYDFGEMSASAAEQMKGPEAGAARKALYVEAVGAWGKLVSKFPDADESSLAQYIIGRVYETKLLDLPKAIEEYRKCNWGPASGQARSRIANMAGKQFTVLTERVWRAGEPARVKVQMRNIEKLSFSAYQLDLEDYFRKMHRITDVESLDTQLIAPDKTWEVQAEGYAKYKPIEQEIEIPMDPGKPGVWAVRVTGAELTATTLVIRSDLDVIVKSSRKALLVFAENIAEQKPWPDAAIIASDGQKVFFEGRTGQDGVFYKAFEELKSAREVSVLAVAGGHVASNALSIADLGLSEGLAPQAYIYTDRPAYRPGQTVNIRAVIREVAGGAYAFEKGQAHDLEVVDSEGRVLAHESLPLSDFGTVHTAFRLDEFTPVGMYTIRCHRPNGPTFNGEFEVQRYKLEPMELAFVLERSIVFRGEPLRGKLVARYYYGEPAAGREVEYVTLDGRRVVATTDEKGEVQFSLDTAPLREEQPAFLRAALVGENVRAQATAFVAVRAYRASVSVLRDVYLAGEPFDVKVHAADAEMKPVAQAMSLKVLRRESQPGGSWAEVLVEEKPVMTEATSGDAIVSITLGKGGQYVFRAEGADRFGNPVTAETQAFISDAEDALKLRILADRQHLKVGETVTVSLHSRLDPALALLTFEGEEIISYSVVRLASGRNAVEIRVANEHFPNFALGAGAMTGNSFHSAVQSFTVERELTTVVKPGQESYEPGEEAKIEILTTDQSGRPVPAELSLAMVDESLYGAFPDRLKSIREFFEAGARRVAALATTTSCTFSYHPATRAIPEALISEQERLERDRAAEEVRALTGEVARAAKPAQIEEAQQGPAAGRAAVAELQPALARARREAALGPPAGLAVGGQPEMPLEARRAVEAARKRAEEAARRAAVQVAGQRLDRKALPAGPGGPGAARAVFPEVAYWNPAVVTGADGKATLTITMPSPITKWRLTARGVTAETLVGQQTASIVTKKDFFAELKLPAVVTEGDSLKAVVRLHNLTHYKGPAELRLLLKAGGQQTALSARLDLDGAGVVEHVFEEWKVPADDDVAITADARAGANADALSRELPIRPWGAEFRASRGGVAEGQTTFWLELPAGRAYSHQALTIVIDAGLEQSLVRTALGGACEVFGPLRGDLPATHADTASDLLGVVSVMQYLQALGRARSPEWKLLADRAQSLIGGLVVAQSAGGGWSWAGAATAAPDDYTSSRAVWALAEARRLGIAMPKDVLDEGVRYLKEAFSSAAQTDDELKSTLLHALALAGEADFGYANRLYRARQGLSPAALAHTALTLALLDRKPMAGEVLEVLEGKRRPAGSGWSGSENKAWMRSADEMTALALLAWLNVRPEAPAAKQAADYLLAHEPWRPARAKGPALAALSLWFGKGQPAENDYRLAVRVNEQPVETIAVSGPAPSRTVSVPSALTKDGKNRVDLQLEGRGRPHYVAVLTGFSAEMANPPGREARAWANAREYLTMAPEYKGRAVAVGFGCIHGPYTYWRNKVSHLRVGSRTHVELNVSRHYGSGGAQGEPGYLLVREHLPAGASVLEDSIRGGCDHYSVGDSEITFHLSPSAESTTISYDLVGYVPGAFRVLPTLVQSVYSDDERAFGSAAGITVLNRGETSPDPYKPTPDELYDLGKAYFDDGRYDEARPRLERLFDTWQALLNDEPCRETARMLLFISIERAEAKDIVRYFEAIKEKYPGLVIPFDKVLAVGAAYRRLEEFERAALVYKGTIAASFVKDAHVAGVLQEQGRPLASVEFMKDLWLTYPDTPDVTDAYLALADTLYTLAPRAHEIQELKERKLAREDLMAMAVRILVNYLTLYPESPAADDAALNLVNAYVALKDFQSVVDLCAGLGPRFPNSPFLDSFEYVEAVARWNLGDYDKAIALATRVAEKVYTLPDGTRKPSDNRDLALYIVGQIWHARGRPAEAIEFYAKVKDKFPDAAEAVQYFERKDLSLEEVATFEPGQEPAVALKYRNVPDVHLLVYRVDLMTLYLTEKNLSRITQVNLAGIHPALDPLSVHLGEGKDYAQKEISIPLKARESGAYLVICRGGDLYASGMVLVTPLKLDVQEDAVSGRVRVNVMDRKTGNYLRDVHVKVIGSGNEDFVAGESDLRGVFVADNIRGTATVIVRDKEGHFAFYRGKAVLQPPPPGSGEAAAREAVQYLRNVEMSNEPLQQARARKQQELYSKQQKGVEAQSLW